MWCLSHIKTINDSCTVPDSNFVHLMDMALDLLSPLTLFSTELETTNIAQHNAEVKRFFFYVKPQKSISKTPILGVN